MSDTVVIVDGTTVNVVTAGTQGPAGANGQGVPIGGGTSQALVKNSATNYDTGWASAALLGSTNNFTRQQYFGQTTLTDAATIAWDVGSNQCASVTLGGNRTLSNPSNMQAGSTYILRVAQDVTGSRTLAFGSNYKWPSGAAPSLSTVSNSVDVLTFYCDGTYMLGVIQKGFA
jgi:hypothetical protein